MDPCPYKERRLVLFRGVFVVVIIQEFIQTLVNLESGLIVCCKQKHLISSPSHPIGDKIRRRIKLKMNRRNKQTMQNKMQMVNVHFK